MLSIREPIKALQFDIAVMVAAEQYEKDGIVSDPVQDEINQHVQAAHNSYCSNHLAGNGTSGVRKFQSLSAFKNFNTGMM